MNHRARTRVVLLLLAAAFSGVVFRPAIAQDTLPPRAYLPVVSRPYPPVPMEYGIQVHAFDGTQYVVDRVQDLGLTWVKQQIRWAYIEKSDDGYSWAEADRVADTAHRAGLKILFSVTAAPGWARGHRPGSGPPDDYQDFYDFVAVMAGRYRGRVQAYEIWNEQNLGREWEGAPLSASDYVRLLAGAYQAIKAVDPEAVVVTGGLAPTGVNDDGAIDDRVYLEQMYEAGLRTASDAVGAHPYGFANPAEAYYTGGDYDPDRGWDDHPCFFFRNTLEDYYAIMSAHGDGAKRVWATEFGWPTTDGMGVPANEGFEYANDIDEQQQADYIAGGYTWAAEWGHVGVAFLWNLNMWPYTGPENEMSKFSIVRGDWSSRPAYVALKALPK